MTETGKYLIALFKSVSHVMLAEKLLKSQHVPYKIIPVPKEISTECGVSIRFLSEDRERLLKAVGTKAEILEIRSL